MQNLGDAANRILDYLTKQTFDKVMSILVIALALSYIVYIEPQRIDQIQKGYLEIQKRNEEFQTLRSAKDDERHRNLEKEIARLNSGLEKRDEASARMLEKLMERRVPDSR